MTVHADRGVIGVPTHAAVNCVCLRLVCMRRISRMASADAGEDRIIGGINMAIGTARTVVWNPEVSMVENRTQPGGGHPGRVAGNAGRWIVSSHVVRYSRSICLGIREIALMTTVAVRRRIARTVVAAGMAIRAGVDHRPNRARNRGPRRKHMRPLQRKPRRRVIKLAIGPEYRVVAS